MAKESSIGKNIRNLRIAHGETQKELGNVINISDTAIAMYESGKRMPNLETIMVIASHYGIPVDRLIRSDFTDFDFSNTIFTWEKIVSTLEVFFPVIITDKALEDPSFSKGYGYTKMIMTELKKGGTIMRSLFERALDVYSESLEETETLESAANILWLIYLMYSLLPDEHSVKVGEAILYSKATGTDFIKNYLLKKERDINAENEMNKKLYTRDISEVVFYYIRFLKDSAEYANLADYYLALRYVIGMVDTEFGQDLNKAIGIEMMLSILSIGNPYAFKLIEKMLSI